MMWLKRLALLITISGGVGGGVALAQDRPAKNPREGDPEAISAGREIFRSRCSECHGLDAKGFRGPDLTTLWASGASDDRLFQTIRRGVPGTEMPGLSLDQDADVWAILAYLKTLNTVSREPNPSGSAENGAKMFGVHCARCHTVNGRGGNLGPDLSRIGASRSRALLSRKIRRASTNIVPGYEPVTLVTRDGRRIRAVKKSEDSYSIQIMDVGERLQGYHKADLRELVSDTTSVMPDFGPDRLNDRDLDDLLRYVSTLRGANTSSQSR